MPIRFETTTVPFFWYRQAQLIVCDNRVYSSFKVLGSGNRKILQHVLAMDPVPIATLRVNQGDNMFQSKYLLSIVYLNSLHYTAYYSQEDFRASRVCPCGLFFDSLTPAIKLIQRNMRTLVRPRIQRRKLALAMGTHDRLGRDSPLQLLDPDLLRLVCSSF